MTPEPNINNTKSMQPEGARRDGEERFHAIFEYAPVGFGLIDMEGRVVKCNPALQVLLGYSEEDLSSKTFPEFTHPADVQEEWNLFLELVSGKRDNYQIEKRFIRKDGRLFWGRISISRVRGLEGKPSYAVGMIEDITERKKAEEALSQVEKRFRDLIENTSDWVWEVDDKIRYSYASPKVAELLGYTPDEVLGKTPFDFMPPEESARLRPNIEELMRSPRPFQAIENVNIRKDGSLCVLETSGIPFYDTEGRFSGLRGIDRDITERKEVEGARLAAMISAANEKARTEAIIAAIGEGINIVDREFHILYQNQVLKDLFGDHPGEHCYWAYDELETICEDCPVEMTFRDGNIHSVEKRSLVNGKMVCLELTASPLKNESGEIVAGVELVRDITERKRAEEALKESERNMKEVQRIANLGSWQLDLVTNQLSWSEETYRIFGIDPQKFAASYGAFLEIVHPEDRARVDAAYTESVQKGSSGYDIEHRIIRQSSEEIRHVHEKCENIKDATGNVILSLGMVHDITSHKKAEENIKALNAELARRADELTIANEELEAYNYTVTHDLRAPLTNINLSYQAIMELCGTKLDKQAKIFLQVICSETERMEQIINALLKFSRISRYELKWETVNLSELARIIAAELSYSQSNRQITFNIAEEITAQGDANLLYMVLLNLLGNAYKFTIKKKNAIIEFGMTELEGNQTYFVRDNGAGFDMAQSDRLFGAFQRLHDEAEYKGHGIGLATVQRIINRHGGRVWAEGEVGKGATFYFTLGKRKLPLS